MSGNAVSPLTAGKTPEDRLIISQTAERKSID
jgi:hypothetical protein